MTYLLSAEMKLSLAQANIAQPMLNLTECRLT